MSSLSKNTQDIVDSVNNIIQQCENIQACIDDIDYGDNDTLYTVVKKCVGVKSDINKNISIDIPDVEIIFKFIRDYSNSGRIYDLIKFLTCLYNNAYTSMDIDDKICNFIYNKLFNIKESV